jgi:hypothetical protein
VLELLLEGSCEMGVASDTNCHDIIELASINICVWFFFLVISCQQSRCIGIISVTKKCKCKVVFGYFLVNKHAT